MKEWYRKTDLLISKKKYSLSWIMVRESEIYWNENFFFLAFSFTDILKHFWEWPFHFSYFIDASFSESLYGLRRRPAEIVQQSQEPTSTTRQKLNISGLTRHQRILSVVFLVRSVTRWGLLPQSAILFYKL